MKNLIKKWLDIQEIDTSALITKEDIRKEVQSAVYEVISPELPHNYRQRYWKQDEYKKARGYLEQHINRRVSDIAVEVALAKTKATIDDLIGGEKFIDDVVARIKAKQL